MKTLGLIGGTTWHSTLEYYRTINQLVNARLVASGEPPGYLVGRTLPGRGAWLCRAEETPLPSEACLRDAVRRKAFARAFRVTSTGRN